MTNTEIEIDHIIDRWNKLDEAREKFGHDSNEFKMAYLRLGAAVKNAKPEKRKIPPPTPEPLPDVERRLTSIPYSDLE